MAGPKFRKNISLSAGMKNQGLRDILTPTHGGVRVESVEAIKAPLHNTKIVIIREKDDMGNDIEVTLQERRNILYNRVDLSTIVDPNTKLTSTTLPAIINELNIKYRCDFTEDDLELVDGTIQAKVDSLGYFGKLFESTGDYCANAIPTVQIQPDLVYWSGKDGNEKRSEWDLYVNGVLQPDVISTDYYFEDWIADNFNGVILNTWIPTDGDDPNEGSMILKNRGSDCLYFELRPRNVFGQFTKPVELAGNNSFVAGDDGSVKFSLAPFVSACSLQYAKPISLVPKNYNFKTADYVRLYFAVEENGVEIDRGYLSWNPSDLYANDTYYAPNVAELTAPNNITSQYPSVERIFSSIKDKFGDVVDVSYTIPWIQQLLPITKIGYLGVLSDTGAGAGQFYNLPQSYSLMIIRTPINGEQLVINLGSLDITPGNAADAYNKLKAYFKPKLEEHGFTVTDFYIAPTPFSSSTGFTLEITTTDDIFLQLISSGNGWDPAFSMGDNAWCMLVDSSVDGALVTEEDAMDKLTLTLRPYEPVEDDSTVAVNKNIRVRFFTKEEFGMEQPSGVYDWIAETFNGQEQIIESCSMTLPVYS